MDIHDLNPEQEIVIIGQQLDSLRAERFQQQLNIVRWSAIPKKYRDGTEENGIVQAKRAVAVIEAQIEALATVATKTAAPKPAKQ